MHKLQKLFVLSLIIMSAAAAQAQISKYPKAMAIRDFEKFVGIWDSQATITVDSVPHIVQYHMNFRRTAGNYGFNMDEAFSDSSLGNLRAANLIGYDNDDKKIHWYYIDNMGIAYERVGQWVDSDNLTFTYATKKGDKKYDEVISITFKGNDMISYRHVCYLDGKEVRKVTGRFTRRKMPAPQNRN